jgi:ankyrin repeat protein
LAAEQYRGEHAFQKIWDLTKEHLTPKEIINELLLATNEKGNTAWHCAAMWGKVALQQEIWKPATDNPTKEEIKNKLFLATNNEGNTAWHCAARNSNLDVM